MSFDNTSKDIFMNLATANCAFFEKYYNENDLYAMNGDGVEIPFDVFKNGNVDHFTRVTEAYVDANDRHVDFGVSSLFLVPRRMFNSIDKNDETVVTCGILTALHHLGMNEVLTEEDINLYVHGHCTTCDAHDGYLSVLRKIKMAWIEVNKENPKKRRRS